MKNTRDLIDDLYLKKIINEEFTLDDVELEKLQERVDISEKELNDFFEKRIHPKSKKILRKLFVNYSNAVFLNNERENQLYYRYGIKDGVKFIIDALSIT